MSEYPENFEFKSSAEIAPQRVGVVLRSLENTLGDLTNFVFSETELEKITETGNSFIDEMTESELAQYLNDFRKAMEKGSETTETLGTHNIFRAVLTKALQLAQL